MRSDKSAVKHRTSKDGFLNKQKHKAGAGLGYTEMSNEMSENTHQNILQLLHSEEFFYRHPSTVFIRFIA